MKRPLVTNSKFLAGLVLAALTAGTASAQSLDDLELRKRRRQQQIGFGILGLVENAVGLNRDRPDGSTMIYVAPQLKIGDKMRVRLNAAFSAAWFDRQENPWDFNDISLQFSHLGFYKDPWAGIQFSGYARYYIPTSKASRNEGSYGQLRLVAKASRQLFGRLFLAFELNGQKYFHRYTTWNTNDGGSASWYGGSGREDFIENNANFGLGQTFTATVTTLPGLDLSAIYGLYQTREYQPGDGHADASGSSLVADPRQTLWVHSFRMILDATYSIGALPWIQRSERLKTSLLSRTYVSLGYATLAPQLDGDHRNLNPFNPKYASAYMDLMVLY